VAVLRPFRALHYDTTKVGSMASVVAPPYDVISPARRDELYGRSPHNVVRIDLSRADDAYADAAATLAQWRTAGVVVRDERPALFLYAQRFRVPGGGTHERVGLIGALRLESFDSGRVRPHERTLERAKTDRLSLLTATRTALSPIFGLVTEPDWDLHGLRPARPPEVEIDDDGGDHHRVWRLDDPAVHAAVAAHLDGHEVFIADGHHRYETALRYRDQRRAAAGAAARVPGEASYDYVLAYLTTMEDAGLVILPTHRVLATLPMAAPALREALARHFTISELPFTDAGVDELCRRLDAAPEGAAHGARIGIAAAGADRVWLASAASERLPLPAGLAPALRALDVSILHHVVLAGVLELPIGERGGTPGLSYTQDPHAALAAVRGGAGAAFFLPPTSVDDLRAVARAGLTMPEKSTYFHPKLLTGLVFYPVDDGT
jgi:uncharacterized protein (DUF1015 family)